MNPIEQLDGWQRAIGGPVTEFLTTYWGVPLFLVVAIAGFFFIGHRPDRPPFDLSLRDKSKDGEDD